MSLRSFFRKLAGRAGSASRNKRGAHSHVNTKPNKRKANKAARVCDYAEADAHGIYDRTFYEDHHLDIPDELDPHGYDNIPMFMDKPNRRN